MKEEQKIHARKGMEYNSSRVGLTMGEYGRHIQKMIDHARTIEDRETRQFFMEMVVILMGQILPSAKPSPELTNKLWNHAFQIAEYDIDVTPPEGVEIVKHVGYERPPKLPYPTANNKFRHYGVNVQKLIAKAAAEEDKEKQELFANAIGSYMKLAYKTWSPQHYMNDESIKGDIKTISEGNLDLPEGMALDFLNLQHTSPHHKQKRRPSGGSNKGRNKRGRRRR